MKGDPLLMKTWHYNEFRLIGKDFGLSEQVDQYDPSHAQFRDAEEIGCVGARLSTGEFIDSEL